MTKKNRSLIKKIPDKLLFFKDISKIVLDIDLKKTGIKIINNNIIIIYRQTQ